MYRYIAGFLLILITPCVFSQNDTSKGFPVAVYTVHNLTNVNSEELDFCPVVYEGKLVFVSEREIDYVNLGENRFEKTSYLSIHYSNINPENDTFTYSKPKLFSNRINQLNHNGPIFFSKDGKTAIFTRTEYYKNNKENIFRPRLYSTIKEKGRWKEITLLNINKDGFSFGHPCLSADGEHLYFSSDMNAGYGGKDIYGCRREGEGWGEPVNLGPEVNTSGNEVFPFIFMDSTLYFSSNGHDGYGGLDLYYARRSGNRWATVTNLGSTINSKWDDFGIFFRDDPDTVVSYGAGKKTGYFSSNRASGVGKDDIYGFTVEWVTPEKGNTLAGRFQYTTLTHENPPTSGIKIYLTNDQGEIVYTALTDEEGFFLFNNLPFDQSFTIKIETPDPELELLILDDNHDIIAELSSNKKGNFVYKKLSYKQVIALSLLYVKDTDFDTDEITKSLTGQLTGKDTKGLKVLLLDDDGEIVATAVTDDKGDFIFENLPYEVNYIIKTEEYDPGIALLIFNEDNVVAELTTNEKGEFIYVKLSYETINELGLLDEIDTSGILTDDIYGYTVKWVSPPSKETTLAGRFQYTTLTQENLSIGGIKIYLTNDQGEIIYTALTDEKGYFVFNNLPFNQSFTIKTDEQIPELALLLLDDNNVVIEELTSNEGGEFVYKKLTYKQFANLSFLYARDTDPLHDTTPITKSLTGQFNYRTSPSDHPKELKVILINDEGKILYTALTDEKGNFVFENLPFDQNYIIKTEEYNPDIELLIFNNDKVVAQLASNAKGVFEYVKLSYEAIYELALLEENDPNFNRGIELVMLDVNEDAVTVLAEDNTNAFAFGLLQYKDAGTLSLIQEPEPGFCPGTFDLTLEEMDDCIDIAIEELLSETDSINRYEIKGNRFAGRFQYKTLTQENPPTGGIKIYLINDQGEIIYTALTDEKGYFVFNNIPFDQSFILKIDEPNPELELLILDDDNNITARLANNKEGKFLYRKLSYKQFKDMVLLYVSSDNDALTKSLEGRFYYRTLPNDHPKELKVFLVNEEGDILYTTLADAQGWFLFNNLPYDKHYIVKIEKYNPNIELLIINKGKVVAELANNEEGKFLYVKLSYAAINNLALLDAETPIVVAEYATSPVQLTSSLQNEEDTSIKDVTLTGDHPIGVAETLAAIQKTGSKDLSGETGEVSSRHNEQEDIGKAPKIYFYFDSYNLTLAAKSVLNEIVVILNDQPRLKLEAMAYCDRRGNVDYNLRLSDKRANQVITYLSSNGIDPVRLTVKGYGETNLAVNCNICTEEQHVLNRRAELNIYE